MTYGYKIKAYIIKKDEIAIPEQKVIWHPNKFIAKQMANQIKKDFEAEKIFDKVVITPTNII